MWGGARRECQSERSASRFYALCPRAMMVTAVVCPSAAILQLQCLAERRMGCVPGHWTTLEGFDPTNEESGLHTLLRSMLQESSYGSAASTRLAAAYSLRGFSMGTWIGKLGSSERKSKAPVAVHSRSGELGYELSSSRPLDLICNLVSLGSCERRCQKSDWAWTIPSAAAREGRSGILSSTTSSINSSTV